MVEGLDFVDKYTVQQMNQFEGKQLKPTMKDGLDLVNEFAV